MYSVVIPVYRNVESLHDLLDELGQLAEKLDRAFGMDLEVVFVVDGSPDNSHLVLSQKLPLASFSSKLLLHSRNFGSFAAIRSGLEAAAGDYIGVMAADLQEPIALHEEFLAHLMTAECDVVVGTRAGREDPALTRMASWLFWRSFRFLVNKSIPKGGVDVFGCTPLFRDRLLQLEESNSSLVGLIFWVGFRRVEVSYRRRARKHGKSAWSLSRKVTYLLDSVFSFTDLPVRILVTVGSVGLAATILGGAFIFFTQILVGIPVPGYASTMLTLLFFGALNTFGLGIVGSYTWRAFENTKRRPLSIVMSSITIPANDQSRKKRLSTP